ncbi:MAG: AbrB/MazE/SpoVT family DNA-binding domain-containing protein [bacterium]|nr:AbrB/MazE/SpoVT family DNA-binding domain-containing protein [bacterium]
MKCYKCGKGMSFKKGIPFNEYTINGWICSCGEKYYDSEQAQKVLLQNKFRKKELRAKLGQIKSNLIIRVPKEVESALQLKKGKEVIIKMEKKGFLVLPA